MFHKTVANLVTKSACIQNFQLHQLVTDILRYIFYLKLILKVIHWKSSFHNITLYKGLKLIFKFKVRKVKNVVLTGNVFGKLLNITLYTDIHKNII